MANGSNGTRLIDGQISFQGGVDSSKPPTIATENNPDGLARNKVAWLYNGNVRSSGINQRLGWIPVVQGAPWDGTGIFQGAFMYQPDAADPHLVLAIGGVLWRVRLDTDNSVQNLSAMFGPGLTMPPTEPQAYFTQGEQFLVWQSGDEVTNPIFYWAFSEGGDGMRRSLGFIGVANPANEIPPAGPMDYYAQRIWYAFGGRGYAAGDIVFNKASGTAPFGYRDSVLHVTENPVAKAGDSFILPTVAGNIRALKHAANLDTATGTSQLFILTRRAVYANEAPVTRDAWTKADLNFMPLQKVVLVKGGTFAERAVVQVNDDLYFPGPPNGDIRSLATALRYFHQPGNIPISNSVNRALVYNDRSMMRYMSGVEFDNRLLITNSPIQTPVGVAGQTVLPLDYDISSTIDERKPPAFEGSLEGLKFLQIVEGDFGGVQKCFAVVWSDLHNSIEIWQLTTDQRFDRNDSGDSRVQWGIEFPAYTFGDFLKPKKLVGGALWIDKLFGTVEFELSYRPDGYPCWIPWHSWKECSARDCNETFPSIFCNGYPNEQFCEAYQPDMDLPIPHSICINTRTNRPSNVGYQFQCRLLIKGWCRIRAFILYAEPLMKPPYGNLIC